MKLFGLFKRDRIAPESVQDIPVEATSEHEKQDIETPKQNDNQPQGMIFNMQSYSPIETIVGKWINGKPLYAQTVYRESNTNFQYGSGVLDYSIFGSDYIDEICMQQVSLLLDDGYIIFNSGFSNKSQSLNIWYTTKDTLYYETDGVFSVENLTITLYYTKQKE
jgi:hypothetical protein